MGDDQSYTTPTDFRDKLKSLGVKTLVIVVARRAAGVWTHIPSIAVQNLIDLGENNNVLLLDFGLRNEMLEHFKVDYAKCEQGFSFLGIVDQVTDNFHQKIQVLNYFQNFLEHNTRCVHTTGTDPGDLYLNFFRSLSQQRNELFLCPYNTGYSSVEPDQTRLHIQAFCQGIEAIVQETKSSVVYITFEGQPELPLYKERLSKNHVMQFCLNTADMIIGMVRTDSLIRLDESLEIPCYLASFPNWESKLRLILTRHPEEIKVDKAFEEAVIGYLPTLDMIAQSIQDTGAIPVVDIITEKYQVASDQKNRTGYYVNNIKKISSTILSTL